MKIVKQHKNRTKTSEEFGIHSGKTIADIPINVIAAQCSYGGLGGKVDYIKIGDTSHDAFIWFDDLKEVRALGARLVEFAQKAEQINGDTSSHI